MNYSHQAQRRLLKMAEEWVPIGSAFRPGRAFDTTVAYLEAMAQSRVRRIPIYTGCQTTVTLPEGLLEQLSPYYRYDAVLAAGVLEVITDYQVVAMPHGRVVSDNRMAVSYITEEGCLLGDISYEYDGGRALPATEHSIMRRRWFTKPRHIEGTVFSMLSGGGSAINYGHWLVDCLPRIHLLQQSGLMAEVDWFLVPAYSADFHFDSLGLLGIPPDKVLVATDDTHLQADKLIACTHPRGTRSMLIPRWMIDWHQASYIHKAPPAGSYPAKIYVSRRDSPLRQLQNEAEVQALLEGHGYSTYAFAELSFLQKVSLMAGCSHMITASGAGMNNLLYAPPQCRVLEIFPQGLVHAQFYSIAAQLQMHYQYMICRPKHAAATMNEGRHEKLYVSPAALEQQLSLLERQPADAGL